MKSHRTVVTWLVCVQMSKPRYRVSSTRVKNFFSYIQEVSCKQYEDPIVFTSKNTLENSTNQHWVLLSEFGFLWCQTVQQLNKTFSIDRMVTMMFKYSHKLQNIVTFVPSLLYRYSIRLYLTFGVRSGDFRFVDCPIKNSPHYQLKYTVELTRTKNQFVIRPTKTLP